MLRIGCWHDIKARSEFENLEAETGSLANSLIRMFGLRGNPQARNLFTVINQLQRRAAELRAGVVVGISRLQVHRDAQRQGCVIRPGVRLPHVRA